MSQENRERLGVVMILRVRDFAGKLSALSRRLIGGVALSLPLLVAQGNDVKAQDTVANEATVTLDAILVEARRFLEDLFDVPVSVTATTGEQLREARIDTSEQLSKRLVGWEQPNYGDDPRTSQPIVRGVGTLSTLLSPDNSTAPTILDGVPLPAFAANMELLDIGQIEALRGPQGTLYGRNSTGGALNVISALADDVTIRRLTTEIGADGYAKGEAMAGGALGENIWGRAAVRYRQNGSYLGNDHPGQKDIGAYKLGAAKGALRWLPQDGTEVRFNLFYDKSDSDTGYAYRLRDSDVFQETPVFERDVAHVSLNVSHELDGFVLKSTTGVTYYDIYNWADNSDGYVNSALFGALGMPTPPERFTFDGEATATDQNERQFYQEVRAQSLDDADIRWVVGGVASYNDFHEDSVGTSNSAPSINGSRAVQLTSQSAALFADVAYPLAERFELGGGLRYTHERKSIDHTYTGNGFAGTVDSFAQDSSRNFDMLSGRASLSYKPTETSIVYGSVSRGNKAGGYARFTGNAAIGLPESGYDGTSIWTYEMGAKAEIGERSALSIAGFYNDVADEALFYFDPLTSTFPIQNFDIRSYGVEVEAMTELGDGFSLSAGLTLTKAELAGTPAGFVGAAVGNDVPNVPLLAGNIALNYATRVNIRGRDAEFSGSVAYRYVGERSADVGNSFDLDAQHIVDAKLGLKFDNVEFYAFGENLIGDLLEQQGALVFQGVNLVVPSRGRTLGLGLSMTF
jgi:iron complex outermembrane receptor protein